MTESKKSFDAVKFMRLERDKISKELVNLSNEEILEHYRKKRVQNPQKV